MLRDGQSWDSRSACLEEDPELFFPVSKTARNQDQVAEAKAVCARCEVRTICLEFALRTGADEGIWGGLDAGERQRIRRSRRRRRTGATSLIDV